MAKRKGRLKSGFILHLVAAGVMGFAGPALAATLNPAFQGVARDLSLQDGFADVLEPGSSLIGNIQGTQRRTIMEFDLSPLFGRTVLSASINGSVGANNALPTGQREHRFNVFSGNGMLDLADYNKSGAQVGNLSHAAGDTSLFNFNVTSNLNQMLGNGSSHFGVRISPVNSQGWDAGSAVLNYELAPLPEYVASFFPTVDAEADLSGPVTTVSDGAFSISTFDSTSSSTDRRGILEFDTGTLPVGISLTGASLELDVNLLTQSPGSDPQPLVYAYAGDGAALPDDVTQTSLLVASGVSISDPGQSSIPLDAVLLQPLLDQSDHVGIHMRGSPNGEQLGFWAIEAFSFAAPPMLKLTYTVPPLAGDFNEDRRVDAADYVAWRKKPGTAGQYNIWYSNFGATAGAGAGFTRSETVPEPVSLANALGGILSALLLGRRFAERCTTLDEHA